MKHVLKSVILITILLFGFWFVKENNILFDFSPAQIAPGPNEAVFFFDPGSGDYQKGNSFSVDLKVNSSVGITSVKAYLNFPTSYLSVSSIETGGSVFTSWWENAYNNTTGKIQLQASLPSPGYSGIGLIARITFLAKNAGSADLSHDSSSLALKPDDANILNLIKSTGGSFTIVDSPSDIIPPVRSNGQPTGSLSYNTTQATLSLATNETAACKYSTASGLAYDSMTNNFTVTGGTLHSTVIGGLSSGNSYNYYIRCMDDAGNKNTNDYTVSFSVASPSSGSGGDSSAPPGTPQPDLIGDFNKDGKVNIFDLSIMLSNWKTNKAEYDLKKDGKIDIFDLSILLSNWTG